MVNFYNNINSDASYIKKQSKNSNILAFLVVILITVCIITIIFFEVKSVLAKDNDNEEFDSKSTSNTHKYTSGCKTVEGKEICSGTISFPTSSKTGDGNQDDVNSNSTPEGCIIEDTVTDITITFPTAENVGSDECVFPNTSEPSVVDTNTPPTAQDSFLTTNIDAPLDIPLSFSDQEKDKLTASLVSPPSNGKLDDIDQILDLVTYTPNPGYTGDDAFTFKANDGQTDSNLATVKITINPDQQQEEKDRSSPTDPIPTPPSLPPQQGQDSIVDELVKIANLKDTGIISDNEFNILKNNLLISIGINNTNNILKTDNKNNNISTSLPNIIKVNRNNTDNNNKADCLEKLSLNNKWEKRDPIPNNFVNCFPNDDKNSSKIRNTLNPEINSTEIDIGTNSSRLPTTFVDGKVDNKTIITCPNIIEDNEAKTTPSELPTIVDGKAIITCPNIGADDGREGSVVANDNVGDSNPSNNNNQLDIQRKLDLLSPDFSFGNIKPIKDGSNCYLANIVTKSGFSIDSQLCVIPGVEYTPTDKDLQIANNMSGVTVYNITKSLNKSENKMIYSVNYFMPYSAMSRNEVDNFKTIPASFQSPPSILPVVNTRDMHAAGLQIKLVAISENLQALQNWLSVAKYGLEWKDRINQIEEIKKCLDDPAIPHLDENTRNSVEQALEDAKIEVAVTMVLKGAWIGTTGALSGTTKGLTPDAIIGGRLGSTNTVEAVSNMATAPVGDSIETVLDKLMDDVLSIAKKAVGKCNDRWNGELALVFDSNKNYKEEHISKFSFDVLEEEQSTDYFYKPIIGNGKGKLIYHIGKALPPPSACNSLTESIDEKFLLEGKFDVRTNIAKLKVVSISPEEYPRKQVLMYRSGDTMTYGFHMISVGGNRDECKVTSTKNAFLEPGIPYEWTFSVDLSNGSYNGGGSLNGGLSTNYKISIVPK